MAAPNRNRTKPTDALYEKTRAKIKTSQLVNALQKNALAKSDTELSKGRIASIKILLDKTLPNLQSTELSSPDGKLVFAVNIHEKQE